MAASIYSRFGSPVEIRARCDDYGTSGGVHVRYLDDGKTDTIQVNDLRTEGGWAAISPLVDAAPFAVCASEHGGRMFRNAMQRDR